MINILKAFMGDKGVEGKENEDTGEDEEGKIDEVDKGGPKGEVTKENEHEDLEEGKCRRR